MGDWNFGKVFHMGKLLMITNNVLLRDNPLKKKKKAKKKKKKKKKIKEKEKKSKKKKKNKTRSLNVLRNESWKRWYWNLKR